MATDVSARLIAELDKELQPLAGVHSERAIRYREELRKLTDAAVDGPYEIAFIGVAGVGKTTAICKLLSLYDSDGPVLSVAAGRTTLCRVDIVRSTSNSIEVIALPEDRVRALVEDVVQAMGAGHRERDANSEATASTEVQRTVRNMAGLAHSKGVDPLKNLLTSRPDTAEVVQMIMNVAGRQDPPDSVQPALAG